MVLTTPGVADSRACSAGQREYEMLVLIGAFEHHHVDLLVILSCFSTRRISATPPAWRSFRVATGGFVHHSIAIQSTICSILRCLVVFLACVQGRRKVRVRVRVRATLALQLDFSVFWKPFVATYTGQLAGRLQNEDWTRTGGWR